MKNPLRLISLYTLLFIFASCQIPQIDDKMLTEPAVDPVIIIEEKSMEIKPIDDYAAYVFTDNKKLKGISGNMLVDIVIEDAIYEEYELDTFFKIGNVLYFSLTEVVPSEDPEIPAESVEHYFSQKNGEIAEFASASDFPPTPESTFVEMEGGMFGIATTDYKGDNVSYVYKGASPIGYKKVDGYFLTNAGLWFSVPETFSTRKKGVYFYPENGNLNPSIIEGRIW